MECLERIGFGVEDLEQTVEPRDLEDFEQSRADRAKLERATLTGDAATELEHEREDVAGHVANVAEAEENLGRFREAGEQVLELSAKVVDDVFGDKVGIGKASDGHTMDGF